MKTRPQIYMKSLLSVYFPWLLYSLAIITTIILTATGHGFWHSYLQSVVFFNGGIQGLWSAAAHLLTPEHTAHNIGWSSNNFQLEMGGCNLALGFTGVFSWFYPAWRIPIAWMIVIIFAVCAFIHIKDRLTRENKAPFNVGPMLYCNIVVSFTLFLAIIFS